MSGPQARGEAEAAEVLDALLAALPDPSRGAASLPDGPDRARIVALRAAMARSLDLYADLFQSTFDTLAHAAQSVLTPSGGAAPTGVELRGRRGAVARGELWLHNTTRAPVRDVRLWLTPLRAHDGTSIDGARGSFSPAVVDADAGASVAVALSVAVAAACAPGVYYGHALAEHLPDLALEVRLRVDR